MRKRVLERVLSILLALVIVLSEVNIYGIPVVRAAEMEELPEEVEEPVLEELPEKVEEPVLEELPEEVEEPVLEELPEKVEEPVLEELSEEENTPPEQEREKPMLMYAPAPITDADTGSMSINMSTYTLPLKIFNYLYYTDGSGNVVMGSGTYAVGGTSDLGITIGDHPDAVDNTAPQHMDIDITLNGLTMNEETTLELYPVYGGQNSVNMIIASDSSLPAVNIAEDADVVMTLNADLMISALVMGENSSLTIQTNGYSVNMGSIAGSGAVSVTGTGTITVTGDANMASLQVDAATMNAANITVFGDMTFMNAKISTSDMGMITAGGNISVSGGSVSDVLLFGYTTEMTGEKFMTFDGCEFINVTTVGAESDSEAHVTYQGTIAASTDTYYQFDYRLGYKWGEDELAENDSWPTAYRVKHTYNDLGSSGTILGYKSSDGYVPAEDGTLELPVYEVDGYTFDGWKYADDSETVNRLQGMSEDLILQAQMTPKEVKVTLTLPDPSPNDGEDPTKVDEMTGVHFGEELTLPSPQLFGYTFVGWKVMTGSLHGTYKDTYQITLEDLSEGESGYELTLEAQWTAKQFPLQLSLLDAAAYAEIYVGGDVNDNANWNKIDDFVNKYSDLVQRSDTSIVLPKITYGQSLGDYLASLGWTYPLLRDTRAASVQQRFNIWVIGNTPITSDYKYEIGSLIGAREDGMSVSAYEAQLNNVPVYLSPDWDTMEYSITVDTVSGWTILVDGVVKTPDANGEIVVPAGSTVTWRCAASEKRSISVWKMAYQLYGETHWIFPEERTYTSTYYYYDFVMPTADVAAACGNAGTSKSTTFGTTLMKQWKPAYDPDLWVDISLSPITFAPTITNYNGKDRSGFWYTKAEVPLSPLFAELSNGARTRDFDAITDSNPVSRYFYEWDNSKEFHVTSNNVETKNQLILISAMSGGIRLKNCKMVATDAYTTGAIDRKLGGVLIEKANTGASGIDGLVTGSYANIVIDNSVNPKYDTTIKFDGENTVSAIMPSTFYTADAYISTLTLDGTSRANSTLHLGTVCGGYRLTVKNLTIQEIYDQFDYLLYTNTSKMQADHISVQSCTIQAPHKRLYCGFDYLKIKASEVYAESLRAAYSVQVQESSYVRVYGDLSAYYYLTDISGTSSVVVDGNVYTSSQTSAYGNSSISTKGYVIVKGNRFQTTVLSKSSSGVLIANTLSTNKSCAVSDGTLIANQLVNAPMPVPVINGQGYYSDTPFTNEHNCKTNGDDYPYATYSNTDTPEKTFTFSGGHLYLLGDYDTGASAYDHQRVLYTKNSGYASDNAVAEVLEKLDILDENGDLKEELRKNPNPHADSIGLRQNAKTAVETQISEYGNDIRKHECVQIGNSTYTSSVNYSRKVLLSGTNIYAAGNLTFFNDTTVTGGNIYCGGTFGSKRDVTISGGSIEALEVGNAYQCTTAENGLNRYAKVNILSGSLITDHLGALSLNIAGKKSMSVVNLGSGAVLQGKAGDDISVESNLYANYMYDSSVYTVEEGNPKSLDFKTSVEAGTWLSLDGKLQMDQMVNLKNPKAGTQDAMWLYDTSDGIKISAVAANGQVNGESENACVYQNRDQFAVYAAKNGYNLQVNGTYNGGFTVSGGEQTLTSNGSTIMAAKGTVTVSFDDVERLENTVVWYTDAAGVLHNALTADSIDKENKKITFVMPYADVEIWITDELSLYLNRYPISFTEKGFAVEIPSDTRRTDSEFSYAGDLHIRQDGSAVTYNRMYVESAAAGNVDENGNEIRRITYTKLNQNMINAQYGMYIADGAQVKLTLNETNRIAPIELPEHASLIISGKTGNTSDTLRFYGALELGSYRGVGCSAKAGTVTYQDLTLNANNYTHYADGGVKSNNTVQFIRCVVNDTSYYTYDSYAINMGDVIFRDCTLKIDCSSDLGTSLVKTCDNLILTDSKVSVLYGGTREGAVPLSGLTGSVILEGDSVVALSLRRLADASKTNLESVNFSTNVVMKGNSKLTADHRLLLRSLNMSGKSVVNIGSGAGYLLCPAITMSDSAEVHAGYVIIAGFSKDNVLDKNAVIQNLINNKAINGDSYTGLNMTGGTINASAFLGGDLNAKLNLSGGTVNAAAIGTYGALFGHGKYIPNMLENEFVYEYAKIPAAGTVVNISNDAKVRVLENGYLGGMHAVVNITGGTVTLENGAVLGLNEEQKEILLADAGTRGETLEDAVEVNIQGGVVTNQGTGSVSVPYGEVTISGSDTSVKVYDLRSERGTILIREASTGLDNPFTEPKHEQVGVLIENDLSASYITITDTAVVYAGAAYSDAPELNGTDDLDGWFRVDYTEDKKSYLYLGDGYGSTGTGDIEVSVGTADKDKNVYGSVFISIGYVLNDDEEDRAENPNPTYYELNHKEGDEYKLTLLEPTRDGFIFQGWYDAPVGGKKVPSLLTTNLTKSVVYARWEPVQVKFSIYIDGKEHAGVDLKAETEGAGNGTYDETANTFVFDQIISVPYREFIFGKGYLDLTDYELRSYAIKQVAFDDAYYSNKGVLSSADSKVTRDLVFAYLDKCKNESGEVTIVLKATVVEKNRALITLDLDLNSKGLPIDSDFDAGTEQAEDPRDPLDKKDTTMASRVYIGETILSAKGFTYKDGGQNKLIGASAPGYTFNGWYTEKDPAEDAAAITGNEDVSKEITLYAEWTPNDYKVHFDAGDGIVVKTKDADKTDAQKELDGIVTYDERLDGAIHYPEDQSVYKLPYAWKDGEIFLGWYYNKGDDHWVKVEEDSFFNLTTISAINTDNILGSGKVGLYLEARYRNAEVTYHTDQAKWMDNTEIPEQTPPGITESDPRYNSDVTKSVEYAEPLAGSTKVSDSYSIISTTSEEYAQNGQTYLTNDYRHTIRKKGYTFQGWYTTKAAADTVGSGGTVDIQYGPVMTLPQYIDKDLELYAAWTPNTYTLTLHSKDHDTEYLYTAFHPDCTPTDYAEPTVKLTVGELINASTAGQWPGRADWYSYNKDSDEQTLNQDQKRYLLGFTFDGLDPGTTEKDNSNGYDVYKKYGATVNHLLNTDTLYEKDESGAGGSRFFLPEDDIYGNSSLGTNYVKDYPSGYNIPMYAVYRERSLVFVHYVQTEDGIQEKIMESVSWLEYSDYPYKEYMQTPEHTGLANYSLLGWYFNDATVDSARRYPETAEAYWGVIQDFKSAAEQIGQYDIMVYTVYAAQKYLDVSLNAKADPTDDTVPVSSYTLPGSMQQGVPQYQFVDIFDNLHLVTYDELKEHLYDTQWTADDTTYTANDTVAVGVTLSWGTTVLPEVFLKNTKDLTQLVQNSIQGGWMFTLKLYHSKVMTEDITYTSILQIGFENVADQKVEYQDLDIVLTPSVYDVQYTVKLPETLDNLNVTDWKGKFASGTLTVDEEVAYGSSLMNADSIPEIEGYTATGSWNRTDKHDVLLTGQSADYGSNLTFSVSAKDAGRIYVTTTYNPIEYTLTAVQDILDRWTVNVLGTENSAEVPYHKTVTFTPKNGSKAENVFLDMKDESGNVIQTMRLDEADMVTEENGIYSFRMPAYDMDVRYVTNMGLYLENGTIDIVPGGYTQNQVFHSWSGDYTILMDEDNNTDGSSTENILSLSGDLSDREIYLGNLKITSDDSIRLLNNGQEEDSKDTIAKLIPVYDGTDSTIVANNILVSEDTELYLNMGAEFNASDAKGTLNLTPNPDIAAIGGNQNGNGEIHLENMIIQMNMSAPSNASGIGAGIQSEAGDVIQITDCEITVLETHTAGAAYTGVWIGSAAGGEVKLTDTNVYGSSSSSKMTGPYVLNGDKVSLTGCQIGTAEVPVYDPIYAKTDLEVTNSSIYQDIYINLSSDASPAKVPIGTAENGAVTVENSTILTKFSEGGTANDYYSGKMKIMDTVSDVVIRDTQILEVSHGDMTITSADVTQGSSNHVHAGNYLLIEELIQPTTVPDLTVQSLAESTSITVRQPVVNSYVILGNVTIMEDAEVNLKGNLKIAGEVDISDGKTLHVKADQDSAYGVTFEGSDDTPFTDRAATYKQTNGNLGEADDKLGGINLSVELDGVTATVHSLYGKTLTLTDSTVTADTTDGEVGSKGTTEGVTNVNINGKTAVKANTIGALGEHGKTFTFVNVDEDAEFNWTGTLQKDLYRLEYHLNDSNFDNSNNPAVLRSSQNSTTPDVISYNPAVPAEPKYLPTEGSSYFANWYIYGEERVMTVLSEADVDGFTQKTTLSQDTMEYASETVAGDGTYTLDIYAWMQIQGSAVIKEGRQFAKFTDGKESVEIYADDVWTAYLTAEGALASGSYYQMTFENELPKNTKLTLAVLDDDQVPVYYAYSVSEESLDTVKFDEFVRMGRLDISPELLEGIAGRTIEDQLLLAVDFSQVEDPKEEEECTATFQIVIGGNPVEIGKVSYTRKKVPTGQVTIADASVDEQRNLTGKVSVTPPADERLSGRDIVLLAEITDTEGNAVQIPYGAGALLDAAQSIAWIDGNFVLFDLGSYDNLEAVQSSTWTISGLAAGEYKIVWELAAMDNDNRNVLGDILKMDPKSVVTELELTALDVPFLDVDLVSIDNNAVVSRVMEQNAVHTVEFEYETNAVAVKVTAERQTALRNFTTANGIILTANNGVVTAAFPAELEKGVYRIRFSMTDESAEDDVYYSFIVR